MFGGVDSNRLNEDSIFNPKALCGSKTLFTQHDRTYRDSYQIFGVNGILFNHESPHRGETFVTRKISEL